ncbi:hypothetical protein [Enhygromyxa salina]|uniref:hypothetical protein n=1 Tax=Enhygromyxa salina TaxID=215803 RepID=UPI000D02ABE3|nr:hypothetical protein [Enhygromyxa salina]
MLFVLTLLAGCGSRPLDSNCDGMCQPAGANYPGVGECNAGVCTPTYLECAVQSEVSTCDEACAAQGSVCVAGGCGGNTYALFASLSWCQNPEIKGPERERECNEPIEWQFSSAVKCCCEQE